MPGPLIKHSQLTKFTNQFFLPNFLKSCICNYAPREENLPQKAEDFLWG